MSEHVQTQGIKSLISTKEAAKIIGCSIESFKGYLSRGALKPHKKIHGKNFYCEETLRKFVPPSKLQKNNSLSRKSSTVSSVDTVEMLDIIKKWQTSPLDNSSSDVEIGVYTEKIQRLEISMKGISKETSEFFGMRKLLVKYVFERRKLLNYLKESHFGRYTKAIKMIEGSY